jgi:hypothetical protein
MRSEHPVKRIAAAMLGFTNLQHDLLRKLGSGPRRALTIVGGVRDAPVVMRRGR